MPAPGLPRVAIHIVGSDAGFQWEARSIVSADLQDNYDIVSHASLAEFLKHYFEIVCGCAIIDLGRNLNALGVIDALATSGAHAPAILVADNEDLCATVSAIKAGAADYLVKPIESGLLLRSIRRATIVELERLGERKRAEGVLALYDALTATERTVMLRLVEGKLNKQIAVELSCCERTVKSRRAQLMKKLRCRSVAEVVRFWRQLVSSACIADEPRIGMTWAPRIGARVPPMEMLCDPRRQCFTRLNLAVEQMNDATGE